MGLNASLPAISLAAAELSRLAATLQGAEAAHVFLTTVLPSGGEEVSGLAAAHFNLHAQQHGAAIAQGIAHLFEASQMLTKHASNYLAEDMSIEAVQKSVEAGINIAGSL